MRQPRVYLDLALHTGDLITLPPETSHYLTQVLRLKSGDLLLPFNAINGEYSAAIDKSDRKHTSIIIQEQQRAPSPETFSVHLGLGLSRGDRMDLAIQKSTELGVAAITPLYTLYSEVKFKQADRIDKKLNHWRKIAVSAAEQSGRLSVPKVQQPMAIEQWLETTKAKMKLRGKESSTRCLDPKAMEVLTKEVLDKVVESQARIVEWDCIKHKPPPSLKIVHGNDPP